MRLAIPGTCLCAAITYCAGLRAENATGPDAEQQAGDALQHPPVSAVLPRPVGLIINGRPAADLALIAGSPDRIFIRRDDLKHSGLLAKDAPTEFMLAEQDYVALSAIAGLTARLEEQGTVLEILADPAIFAATRIAREDRPVLLDEIAPAAFISYDLTFVNWNGQNSGAAFFDAGASGSWGLLGTTALLQKGSVGLVRLDTAFQRDFLGSRLRLVIGDTTTRGAEWNLPARFAGIRIGTDFSLRPDVVNYPVPALSGAALLPSTVELLAGASSQSASIQPGPFAIDYQPVFSGAGEVTMTVTDSAGITRRQTQSFYTSPRLLKPGRADFSIEAGFLRENYASNSFDYGGPFVAAFARHGLNDWLTVAVRAEISGASRMAGIGIGAVLAPFGEIRLAAAISESPGGTGTFWRAQLQRIAPSHSLTLSYQRENARFARVGDARRPEAPLRGGRNEFALGGSLSLGPIGDINFGHIETRISGSPRFASTTIGLSGNLDIAFYNLGVRRTQWADEVEKGAFVSVTLPLGARTSASLRIDRRRALAVVAGAPPNDQGIGYQLATGREARSGAAIIGGSALIRTSAGDIGVSGDRNEGGKGIRLSARGALAVVSGKVIATPRIDNAFALVEVGGEDDVTLYYENRPVVAKGGQGRAAILTGLQPYAENRIAIDVGSLPITAIIDAAEKFVVPGYRQAVKVRFGGAAGAPLTVAFIDQDGKPLKPGLDVTLEARSIGLTGHDGLAFFPAYESGARVTIRGNDYRCDAELPSLADNADRGWIGPVVCSINATWKLQ